MARKTNSLKYNFNLKKLCTPSFIYFAISLLTEIVDNNIPIFNNSETIQAVKNKIDNIYKQIKVNEIKPNTDYLFTGLNSGNLEKTIAKLDKRSRLNNIIRSNN